MKRAWATRREQVTHADDWLMTYADMITLLFCLFAVLLSLALHQKITLPKSEAPQQKAAAPEPVVPPPARAPVMSVEKLSDVLRNDPAFHGLPPAEPLEESTAEPIDAKPVVAPPAPPPVMEAVQTMQPAEVFGPPMPEPAAEPNVAKDKGDRITILEMNSAAFFGSGSATLSEPGKVILRNVAVNLQADDRFKDYQITVEGHTDDSPISTPQFPSNWELSTARASAVVHYFLDQGIPAVRLRAAGYADTFPVAPNRDANSNAIPANQAQNRRVVIKLEKIEKTED
jgi:chemotaxis protein MotB